MVRNSRCPVLSLVPAWWCCPRGYLVFLKCCNVKSRVFTMSSHDDKMMSHVAQACVALVDVFGSHLDPTVRSLSDTDSDTLSRLSSTILRDGRPPAPTKLIVFGATTSSDCDRMTLLLTRCLSQIGISQLVALQGAEQPVDSSALKDLDMHRVVCLPPPCRDPVKGPVPGAEEGWLGRAALRQVFIEAGDRSLTLVFVSSASPSCILPFAEEEKELFGAKVRLVQEA